MHEQIVSMASAEEALEADEGDGEEEGELADQPGDDAELGDAKKAKGDGFIDPLGDL